MALNRLLIANRGEIAIRIARAAAEMEIRTVAMYSEDDARSLHTRRADESLALKGIGVPAYLDAAQIVTLAKQADCDAIHPGYGFLSENAAFARLCAEAGIVFVGPQPKTLELFGDKAQARALAKRHRVPILAGTAGPTTLAQAHRFFASLGPGAAVMIKAIAGGGGRGMRPVFSADTLDAAFERCASEALAAFGNGEVYVEQLLPRARHIEVQIAGDGTGAVSHLWERECSLQRHRQKLVEIAPAPALRAAVRARLLEAAIALASAVKYRNLGTFEFLVDLRDESAVEFAFIEANARLQVEHTVTEEVTGVDLVKTQLGIAAGRTLADLHLTQNEIARPRGIALQARINMETMAADGTAKPGGGILSAFEVPSGPGVRVDTFGYAGYQTSPRFDSLLAKLVVHSPSGRLEDVAAKTCRSLAEFRIAGVPTNLAFLQALLGHAEVTGGKFHTRLIEERLDELLAVPPNRTRHFESGISAAGARLAGAKVDPNDPLAVLTHGLKHGLARGTEGSSADAEDAWAPAQPPATSAAGPDGTTALEAPMQGTVVSLEVSQGDVVRAGQQVFVLESMKMQHAIVARSGGIVRLVTVSVGDTVFEGHPLVFLEENDSGDDTAAAAEQIDLDAIRPDLAEVRARQAKTKDAARPDAVARRRKTGQRTTRENVADLCDADSFVEYGSLVLAARRLRNSVEELIEQTPADGLVMGVGRVNGEHFGDEASRVAVVAYDYTVLAGTQGKKNHQKQDRMFRLAEKWRLPLVLFAEGGGGRPGDTDVIAVGSLQLDTFHRFARLSGSAPLVGVTSGRCFAGNAVLLGCCDVVIATANSTIGMGGPAMIEGGGLGVYRPEEVGPMSVQVANGVVDIAVADEAEAVRAARQYLSYFQGALAQWTCPDQRLLRSAVPENRLRAYDMRKLISTLADTDSVLELRRGFGPGMITALARIEGRSIGVVANNPLHLAGAIDSNAADKAARFVQLCDAHDIPILFLCDTPGNMVGPEAEKTALVRHCCRLYVIGANVTVPTFTVVTRKAYGLGALAMAGGSFHASFFAMSWPTGEFGGMGLEGAVKLGYRNELAAIQDPAERKAAYEKMVAAMYEKGKALSTATLFEIDDVIDPADTRRAIIAGLRSVPSPERRQGKKRPFVDTW